MTPRPKLVRIGYWFVTAYVAFTALMLFLENTRLRSSFTDHASPFCLISLFVVIPIAIIGLFLLNRKFRKEHTKRQRVFMHAARTLFFVAWLFSCFPIVFLAGLMQPWPLTLLHGPDTGYARGGFTTHTGFAPPSSVSRIYYRTDDGWLDEHYRLRFHTGVPEVVQQIVRYHNLKDVQEQKMMLFSYRGPKWWKEKQGKKDLRCYFRENSGSYYCYLWYDPHTGTVWYEERV